MSNSTEKRSSFRILESLKFKYEVLSDLEFNDALRRVGGAGSVGETSLRSKMLDIDARLDQAIFSAGRQAPGVKEALTLLNEKLQLMMRVIPEFQHNPESLADAEPQECELSADSLVFNCNEALTVDTKLKLRFFLLSDNRYFETLASVYRVDEAEDGRPGKRIVACFEGMPSADREALFQHLFSMQSETLRMRRINAEDAG